MALLILGIVGSEAAKFTPETEDLARFQIDMFIEGFNPTKVVSGKCHLGGVDLWAIEIAKQRRIETEEFAPKHLRWEPHGYKERNLKIAASDHVLCVTLRTLPDTYRGMRFNGCYHCGDRNPPHVKSGGCWTAWRCKERSWAII